MPLALHGGLQQFDRVTEFESLPGAGDGGVVEFSAQQGRIPVRQRQQHLIELRSLALVHGHGKGGLMLRQAGGGDTPDQAIRSLETDPLARFSVRQQDADIPVLEVQIVIVALDHDRASGIPAFA